MTIRPLKQKTIGLLGGSSDVATVEYYRSLNQLANDKLGGWDIAETIIIGMNFGNIQHFLETNNWSALEEYISGKMDQLIAADADVVLSVSNTLHKVAAPLAEQKNIPFIHIADATGQAIAKAGLKRIALFGTKPVMEMDYIREHYRENFDLDIVVPTEEEQVDINNIIFDELVKHQFLPTSKARYLEIADRMVSELGVEGLILGCTEIFLLIDQVDHPQLPMFNTMELHCQTAIDFILQADQRAD